MRYTPNPTTCIKKKTHHNEINLSFQTRKNKQTNKQTNQKYCFDLKKKKAKHEHAN